MMDALDTARQSAVAGYLRCLDAGAFFEAHEILEAFWMTYTGRDREFYRGLIQAAVALHHDSSGNAKGASSVAARARENIRPFAPRHARIDVQAILARLEKL